MAQLWNYHDTWETAESVTTGGYDDLVEMAMETMIAHERAHRRALCRVAFAVATTAPLCLLVCLLVHET